MNILFIHEVEWIKKVVYDIHHLAESLSLSGHNVFAIDYANRWTRNKCFDFGSLKTTEVNNISRAFPNASVSLKRPGFIKIPGISRISASITHYFAIKKTIEEESIDVIILYSAPTNGLQTICLAKKYGIPVVFRSIDTLSELVPYSLLRYPTKIIEKIVYSNVDMILSITHSLSDYVVNMGADRDKVDLLPLMVDLNLFHPLPDTKELRQKYGFNDNDKIIVYTGGLYDFSGLDKIIDNFAKILDQIPEAKLIIVGDGNQRTNLQALIDKLGLGKHVIMTGVQPYESMPEYINIADICVNPFILTEATRDIFPSKTIQYLACSKAVIATPLPGMLAIIPGKQQGVVYAESENEMIKELVSLLKSPSNRERLGIAGLKYVRQVNSFDSIVKQLEHKLVEVISDKHSRSQHKLV